VTGRPFVLDTDIGTNVDDLLALLLVLGSDELDLVGVTTVSGDVGTRAAVAEHALRLAGRPDVPVVAGAAGSLSGRPARWGGYEDRLTGGSSPGADGPVRDATDWLRDAADRHGGRLEIGAVAPLTNLATARRTDPGFASQVRRVHLMGGDPAGPEHNLAADAVAAAEVLEAFDVQMCGTDVTGGVTLDGVGLRAVLGPAADGPLGRLVSTNAALLWDARSVSASVPHDPLALVPAVRPDLVSSVRRPTGVALGGPEEGRLLDRGREQSRVTAIAPEGVAEAWRRVRIGAGG